MNLRLHWRYALVVALLAAGVVFGETWFRYFVHLGGGVSVPLAKELSTIPSELGEWKGTENPIPGDVLMKIGAEDTLSRDYTRAGGSVQTHLYIAYFGGIRGTAPHHPDVCMPGGGWDILDRYMRSLKITGLGDTPVEVHMDVFEHRATMQKRIVVWWEYIHGQNVASTYMQRLKWVLPGFLGGKRGSILQVQVGSDFSGDAEDRMTALAEFIDRLGPYLHDVLPKQKTDEAATD